MDIPLPKRLLLFFTWILCFSISAAFAQSADNFRAPVAMYLELGGGAGFSLNLDYLTYQSGSYKSSVRLGAGVAPTQLGGKTVFIPSVPVEILGFIGKEAKHAEFGAGYIHHFTSDPALTKSYFTGRFGFRYQDPKGGYVVRVSIVPLLYKDLERTQPGLTLSPGFGLSIGKSF